MKIYNGKACLLQDVFMADNVLTRARGLLFRKPLEKSQALLITRCNSVHTWFMTYPLDIIYLAKDGSVLKVVKNLRPYRFSVCWRAHFVVEAAPCSQLADRVNSGDLLTWLHPGGERL